MQRHGPAPPCGATALASPALCSCAGRRAARRSLPYLSPDCSALAVQWQLALTSAIAGCSACLCLPSASHSGTEQALSTQHAAHSCQAAKAAPAQVQRHACPLPDGLGRGQMRTAPGRASAPGSSRSSTRTASPRTHTSQQPRAADRRHAPGCAVSSACFRLVWQETPAGRLHRVAARWHSYAVCLSFADRRSCLLWLRLGVMPLKALVCLQLCRVSSFRAKTQSQHWPISPKNVMRREADTLPHLGYVRCTSACDQKYDAMLPLSTFTGQQNGLLLPTCTTWLHLNSNR